MKNYSLARPKFALKSVAVTFLLALVGSLSLSSAVESREEDRYAQQKEDMGEAIYPLYRMLERIMQTNSLDQAIAITSRTMGSCEDKACNVADQLPEVSKDDDVAIWAIQIINGSMGAHNASADSRLNLIQISRTLQNTLAANPEALACVVAHEVAHIQENHSKSQLKVRHEQDQVTAKKVASAIKNAHAARRSQQFFNALAAMGNAYNAGASSARGDYSAVRQSQINNHILMSQIASETAAGNAAAVAYISRYESVLSFYAPKTYQSMFALEGLTPKLVKRTMRDIKQYVSEFTKADKAVSRIQELEADSLAVVYMANAGLNPERCIDTVKLLHRQTGDSSTGDESTHPGEKERLKGLRDAIDALPPRLKRKYAAGASPVRRSLLPYIYDKDSQIVRIALPGTPHLDPGDNDRNQVVDSVFGN